MRAAARTARHVGRGRESTCAHRTDEPLT